MFTQSFDRYVCECDSIQCEIDGSKLVAMVYRDDDMGAPWKEHDGHGPVSGWTRRDKKPGELILSSDRDSYRYYDMQAAIKQARKEGWGSPVPGNKDQYDIPGETKGQKAVRAAQHDFEMLKAWCNDEWYWGYITVTVTRDGVTLAVASLGGFEVNYPGSDNSYLTEVANDLIDDAMGEARERLATLMQQWKAVET